MALSDKAISWKDHNGQSGGFNRKLSHRRLGDNEPPQPNGRRTREWFEVLRREVLVFVYRLLSENGICDL